MEFNENYRYETRPKKEKKFCIVSLFQVLKVNKENDTQTCEKTLMRFTL